MFYVRLFVSSKSGKPCCVLLANLGYAVRYIAWDQSLCAELLGISQADLACRLRDVAASPAGSIVEIPVTDIRERFSDMPGEEKKK